MKIFIEKVADWLKVFSPIVLLVFVCSSYLKTPVKQNYIPVPGINEKKYNSGDVNQQKEETVYNGLIYSALIMNNLCDCPIVYRSDNEKN